MTASNALVPIKYTMPENFDAFQIVSLPDQTLMIREVGSPINDHIKFDAKTNSVTPFISGASAIGWCRVVSIGKNFILRTANYHKRDETCSLYDQDFKELGAVEGDRGAFREIKLLNAEQVVFLGNPMSFGKGDSAIQVRDIASLSAGFESYPQFFSYTPLNPSVKKLLVSQDDFIVELMSDSKTIKYLEMNYETWHSNKHATLTFDEPITAMTTDREGRVFFSHEPNYLSFLGTGTRTQVTWTTDFTCTHMIARDEGANATLFGLKDHSSLYAFDLQNGLYYQFPETVYNEQVELVAGNRLAYLTQDDKETTAKDSKNNSTKLAVIAAPSPFILKQNEVDAVINALIDSDTLPPAYVRPLIKLTAEYAYSGLVKSLGIFNRRGFKADFVLPKSEPESSFTNSNNF